MFYPTRLVLFPDMERINFYSPSHFIIPIKSSILLSKQLIIFLDMEKINFYYPAHSIIPLKSVAVTNECKKSLYSKRCFYMLIYSLFR